MACLEHRCPRCGFVEFNNAPLPSICPDCATALSVFYDEPETSAEFDDDMPTAEVQW